MTDEPQDRPAPKPRFQATIGPDGKISVPISHRTRRRLDQLRKPGETDDEAIRRIMGPSANPPSHFVNLNTITEEDQRKLDIALGIKAGTLKMVAPDEKVKLSKDPDHPSKFVVAKKADVVVDEERLAEDFALSQPDGTPLSHTSLGGSVSAHIFGISKAEKAARSKPLTIAEQIARNAKSEAAALAGLFSDPALQDWARKRNRVMEATAHLAQVREKVTEAEARLLVAQSNAAVEFVRKIDAAPVMQKVGESGFHQCVEAWREGSVLVPGDDRQMPAEVRQAIGVNPTIFVVQHDWAGAFAHAEDFEGGEYRIPYEEAIYEFRISGARVIACLATEDCLPVSCILNVKTPHGWMVAGFYTMDHGRWKPASVFSHPKRMIAGNIMTLCAMQIRAICIALDAQVAETTVVRAPHRLNMKRERKGRLPLFDYHVIDLARRNRYAPRDLDPNREIHHRRMHFVRGHWRHYDAHKTWIHWHLRGDPDLGFIDKEYRL